MSMYALTRIHKSGHSSTITIPSKLLFQAGMKQGDQIILETTKLGIEIILAPKRLINKDDVDDIENIKIDE
jgi:antitoxin component of MazEF toxin-antitoxin module